MSILEGVGLQFKESMSGHIVVGETDPRRAAQIAREQGVAMHFDVRIGISDLSRFLKISDHTAELSGTVTCEHLGGTFLLEHGVFNLFSLDPETGMRQMSYAFRFTAADGQAYFLRGHKEIHDDRGKMDVVEDML